MLARVRARRFQKALDVGCGEGRFCRKLADEGVSPVGIDPTSALLRAAKAKDVSGAYVMSEAEYLPFPDRSFDLVVSYVTLVDIPEFEKAIGEMARVLMFGGRLLVANLNPVLSAGMKLGWKRDDDGSPQCYQVDDYGSEWSHWVEWSGVRVVNWHRPLGAYMQAFLSNELVLRHYDEPAASADYVDEGNTHARVPWFHVMEWEKSAA